MINGRTVPEAERYIRKHTYHAAADAVQRMIDEMQFGEGGPATAAPVGAGQHREANRAVGALDALRTAVTMLRGRALSVAFGYDPDRF